VIRQLGYSRLQFRQMLAQEMLIGQLRAGVAGSGFVTDARCWHSPVWKNRPAISLP
jgi:peptidyl-prolyl cis-trans isomerase D